MTKKLMLDAGHGGRDSGAVGNGLLEKNLALTLSLRLEAKLKSDYTGIEIRQTRTGDTYPALSERVRMANLWGADLFVSEHVNAGGGTGYETLINNTLSLSSSTGQLAKTFNDHVVNRLRDKGYNIANRGIKNQRSIAVLRDTRMPAILPETLFIDRLADANLLKSDAFLDDVVESQAEAIAMILNLKKRNGISSSSPAQTSASQPVQSTVIKIGDRGEAVKSLQERLNDIGYDCGVADGVFGNATDTAVKHFQRDKGLTVDGIVGQNTLDAITKEENLMKEKIDKLEKELAELKKMITEGNAATPSPWAKDVWDNSVYFDKSRPQAMISRQETALVVNRVIANTRKYITDPLEERIAELEKSKK